MNNRILLAGILLITVPVLSFLVNPDQLIWAENFDTTSANWRTSNSIDELYLIQNGEYVLYRKSSSGPSILLPEEGDLYGECRSEMRFRFDPLQSGSSAGLVFMAKPNGSQAYVLEINDRREYRVRKIEDGVFKELSGTPKNAGWIKEKSVAKSGDLNLVSASYESGILKLTINGKDVWIGDAYQQEKGKVGIYIGPASKARIDDIRVYVSEEEAQRIRKDREDKDPIRSELTEIIITLRNTINAQNREIDSLTKLSSKLQAEQDKFDNNPRNVRKLSAKIRELEKEVNVWKWKHGQLEKENKKLEKFQENIRKNTGGDIVIKLTNALNDEQEKNRELEKENKELQARLKALELELGKYKSDEQE